MKYIIIKAFLGFGDRLESLMMYVDYALTHNLIMCIDWSDSIWSEGTESFHKYFSLNMPQIELKDIPPNLKVFPEFWKDKLDVTVTKQLLNENNHILDLGILHKVYDCDVLVVTSSGIRAIYTDRSFFYKRLKVIHPEILEEINKRRFVTDSIGIHLRGTDRIDTLDFKLKRLKQLQLKLLRNGVFDHKKVIVSDDQEFIQLWKNLDSSSIILSKKLPKGGPIHKISSEYKKDELNIQLIIDFLTLALCEKIFSTSEDSRFAQMAGFAHSNIYSII